LTSRQFKEEDFVKVIDLIDRAVNIGLQAQQGSSKFSSGLKCLNIHI